MIPDDTTIGIFAEIRDALQDLGRLARQDPQPQSSVELARNAKGETQIQVKVYAADAPAASILAQKLYEQLRGQYPLGGQS